MARVIKTAARASDDELHEETNNSVLLQQPFSTRHYKLSSARLATTLVELDILRGTQAIARQGYDQNDVEKTILMPTVFAKVDGLPNNEKPYWDALDKIRDSNGLEALISIHFKSSDWYISEDDFNFLTETELRAGTLMACEAWSYQMLNRDLQKSIAEAIVDMVEDWPFSFDKTDDNLAGVLSMALDMPKEILDMTAEVDYPKEVPLLAFIHQEDFGIVENDDIVAMTLFHYLGWDVVVYSPHGYASLENYLKDDEYDHFSYQKMRPTSSGHGDKKQGFFGKLFN